MKTTVIALAALAASSASAQSHDYSKDLLCSIIDRQGNKLFWSFGPNTNGSSVETGFRRNGATGPVAPPGSRPVWLVETIQGVTILISQNNPEWRIGMNGTKPYSSDDNAIKYVASLFKGVTKMGEGTCGFIKSAHNIADEGL